ncbi:cation:proton antiporter [Fructobacillus sp. M2-14]|uniref:Cation:proton antiporter n=1 Tax=Fructobacillus broussonetiae TaxID=2713173 RepID=A0ABS5R2A1_9LACO|nr:cation:proton antiporter [Fructobacillus broussonetiae]MBS9338277.1 cation:proton antiporter [Fructobacillus broussonetiae]
MMTGILLASMLFCALLMGYLAEKVGLPAVVGQIAAGLVLGPAGFGLIHAGSTIEHWAEIGLLLLMFLAGIESDFGLLKRHLKQANAVALSGVVVPFVVFFCFGHLMGHGNKTALLWAVLFSATSVSITAQILTEYGQIKSDAGATILGAAVLDDLIAIFMWTVFQTIFGVGETSKLGLGLLGSTVVMLAFLVSMLTILALALQKVLPVIGRIPQPGLMLTLVFSLILFLAFSAEWLGLSGAIVAFLIGVIFSRQQEEQAIERGMTLIGNTVFIPIFFVNIGLKVSLHGLAKSWLLILALTILAILTKYLGASLAARWTGLQESEANLVGIGMVSRGEMALVILDLALAASLIGQSFYADMVFVILLTTIFTPIALKPLMKRG